MRPGSGRGLLAIALVGAAWVGVSASDRGEERSETRHVRVTDARLERALDDGLERSTTLRALVDRLEGSDVIVHITAQTPSPASLGGEVQFVGRRGGARYLRITIRQELQWPALVAMMGHELQHAVEIADAPAVVDSASLARHYAKIGFSPAHGLHETEEAKRVSARVLREFRSVQR